MQHVPNINIALCVIAEGWFNSFIGQQDYKTQWISLEPVTSGNYVCAHVGHEWCCFET